MYKKDSLLYSNNYTCHTWVGGYLLVGTDKGEILLCDSNAEFKFMLVDSPLHSFKIQNFLPLKGDDFMVAERSGSFCYYER